MEDDIDYVLLMVDQDYPIISIMQMLSHHFLEEINNNKKKKNKEDLNVCQDNDNKSVAK